MTVIGEIVATVFIVIGSIVCLFSAIGMLRFPDFYNRSHAASKNSALGVLGILSGTFLFFIFTDEFIRSPLLIFFFSDCSVGAHVNSAYQKGRTLGKTSQTSKNFRNKMNRRLY